MTRERLQKILAAAGLGSRRGCETLIEEGRVEVNGVRALLGSSADPGVDRIRVDGSPLPARPKARTFALYKTRGIVSSLSAQGERATVRDMLPFEGRFYPIGRLDMDSEGLILLTNDGDLAQRISHPSYEVEKEYSVLLARRPTDEQLAIWKRGVVLEDGFRTAPMAVKFESTFGRGAWVRVVMHEGRKHELRDIGRTIGLPVVRIIRKRIGGFILGDLKPGAYRELTPQEAESLQALPGLQKKVASKKTAPGGKSGFRYRDRAPGETVTHQARPYNQKKGAPKKNTPGGKSGFRYRDRAPGATKPHPALPGQQKKDAPKKNTPGAKPAFRRRGRTPKETESRPAHPYKRKQDAPNKTSPGGKEDSAPRNEKSAEDKPWNQTPPPHPGLISR